MVLPLGSFMELGVRLIMFMLDDVGDDVESEHRLPAFCFPADDHEVAESGWREVVKLFKTSSDSERRIVPGSIPVKGIHEESRRVCELRRIQLTRKTFCFGDEAGDEGERILLALLDVMTNLRGQGHEPAPLGSVTNDLHHLRQSRGDRALRQQVAYLVELNVR